VTRAGLSLLALVLAGCSGSLPAPQPGNHQGEEPVVVPFPPPPGKVEIVPPRPADIKKPVWIDGEWQWKARRWVWAPGSWQESLTGGCYAPSATARQSDGTLVFFAGSWKKSC
jgi:hypothetical protein